MNHFFVYVYIIAVIYFIIIYNKKGRGIKFVFLFFFSFTLRLIHHKHTHHLITNWNNSCTSPWSRGYQSGNQSTFSGQSRASNPSWASTDPPHQARSHSSMETPGTVFTTGGHIRTTIGVGGGGDTFFFRWVLISITFF